MVFRAFRFHHPFLPPGINAGNVYHFSLFESINMTIGRRITTFSQNNLLEIKTLLKASVTCFSTFVTTMALAWAFAKLDYQSSIMANEGTQTRSRQLEEQVRAMRESMDKIQADLAERMQQ